MEKLIEELNRINYSEWQIIKGIMDQMFKVKIQKETANIRIDDFEKIKMNLERKVKGA